MIKIKEFFKNLWKKIKSNPFGFIGRVVLFVLALVILICSFLPKGNKQCSAYASENNYTYVHNVYFFGNQTNRTTYPYMSPADFSCSYLSLLRLSTLIDLSNTSLSVFIPFSNYDPYNIRKGYGGRQIDMSLYYSTSDTNNFKVSGPFDLTFFAGFVDSDYNYYPDESEAFTLVLRPSTWGSSDKFYYAISYNFSVPPPTNSTISSYAFNYTTKEVLSCSLNFSVPLNLSLFMDPHPVNTFLSVCCLNYPSYYADSVYSSYYYGKSVFNTGAESSYSEAFDAGKTEGLQEGYNNGFSAGKTEGFSEGKQEGLTEGYNNGYNVGLKAGETEGYGKGYDKGYEDGLNDNTSYNVGWSAGHTAGRNEALTEGLTNPVVYILQPVSTFLDTKLFGVVSIGQMLSVALFVMIAVIFLKMFAGG